jgi:hypothetical protein
MTRIPLVADRVAELEKLAVRSGDLKAGTKEGLRVDERTFATGLLLKSAAAKILPVICLTSDPKLSWTNESR